MVPQRFSKLMEQVVDVPDEELLDLKRSLFILDEELDKNPCEENAFGRIADLCFFTESTDEVGAQNHV